MKTALIAFCFLVFVTIHLAPAYGNTCGQNQVWSTCTSGCPPRCQDDGRICAAVCGPPGCACAPGFKLSNSGSCIQC